MPNGRDERGTKCEGKKKKNIWEGWDCRCLYLLPQIPCSEDNLEASESKKVQDQ